MSAHEHLSDDVLIDGLYGLIDVEGRIGGCPLCAARWTEMQGKRSVIAAPLDVPAEVLAAQRRNIYARIEHPSALRWAGPAVAAAAAVCVLAIGVFVHHPATTVRSAPASVSETQPLPEVYSDVYSMEQSFEPAASASFRVLFESDGTQAEGSEPATKR